MDAQIPIPSTSGAYTEDVGRDRSPQFGCDKSFDETLLRWRPYVPQRYHPFINTWTAAYSDAVAKGLSKASLRSLRGLMRQDVDEMASVLWDASPAVVAAWVKLYPSWVAALISDKASTDPLFAMTEGERARAVCDRATTADTERKRQARNCELAKRL